MNNQIRNIKGTKDILLQETLVWQFIESQVHLFFKQYGFEEIRTPAFENTNLFIRSIGEQTDIVSKEMYSWIDQGGNKLTLKPEVTASVARAYIQHNLGKKFSINKLYYIDSLFRRERPQKGRYRQFKQFGIEVVGSSFPEQDAEVISLAYNFYKFLGIKDLRLKINSIGSKESRSLYKDALYKYLLPYKNKLSTLSQKRLKTNPLRILDTKIDFEIEILNQAPHILDYINKEDREHFDLVLNLLDSLKIKYIIDHKLVRGLDYYCKTVFEIQNNKLGSQDALCGGGRYDYLIEELGGKPAPAIGFAAGIERLILALDLNDEKFIQSPDVYIISLGEQAIQHSLVIAESLRKNQNLIVITEMLRRSLKAQIKDANRLNAEYVIIIGEDELKNQEVIIKNMNKGEQIAIPFDKINSYFVK
tara:strand:+ start:1389 stop:2645 length:1257 start_codon:yes stop_codon:yes gene_type:complete